MDYVIIILISILLGIGFCLGPLHMMLVYTYCTAKLRSSKYGYLEYYDDFLEIWNTIPYYRENADGSLVHSLLECKTKEELEDYRKRFRTINNIKDFIRSEEQRYMSNEENKCIY